MRTPLIALSTLWLSGCDGLLDAVWSEPGETVAFAVQATAFDPLAGQVIGGDLCLQVEDASPVIAGDGAPVELAWAEADADGLFVIDTVQVSSGTTWFTVRDCDQDDRSYITMSNSFPWDALAELDGGTFQDDLTAIPHTTVDYMMAEADQLGLLWDQEAVGAAIALAHTITHDAVGDAVVQCGGCDALYFDMDIADGMFSTAGQPNTATIESGFGAVVLPGLAPTSVSFEGGGATFSPTALSAYPDRGVITMVMAN